MQIQKCITIERPTYCIICSSHACITNPRACSGSKENNKEAANEHYQPPHQPLPNNEVTSELSSTVKSDNLQVPTSLTAGSSAESLAGFSLDDDLAKEIAEIEDLEDAEQRYPSLDEFDLPDGTSQKSAIPLRLTSMKTSHSDAISSKSIEVLKKPIKRSHARRKNKQKSWQMIYSQMLLLHLLLRAMISLVIWKLLMTTIYLVYLKMWRS